MAKINIPFNNSTYSIEESALAAATAALKKHLSETMGGSGATINFGGIPYNIDSTKLQAATNTFIADLGKISGTGSKVVVNGQEYNIGTDKIASAVANLHTAFGALQSGGNETVEPEVIFPEQTLNGFEGGGLGYSLGLPETFNLVAGETYSVQWGENMYTGLMAYEAQIDGAPCVYIGDGSGLGYAGNNEMFAIISFDGYELLASYVPISSQNVAIYKGIYGENTNAERVVLSERTLTFAYDERYQMNGSAISTDCVLYLVPSKEYKVVWGDAEYNLTATEYNRENGDDAVIIILGNPSFVNPEYQDNGMPFAIADIPLLNGSVCTTNEEITQKKVAIYA